MSIAALAIAVRNKLQTDLVNHVPNPERSIRLMPDGRPAASSGQVFVAIHGTDWSPTSADMDQNRGLAEEFALACTVSIRTPVIPPDRIGDEVYINMTVGLSAICRQIMLSLDKNIDLINSADALLADHEQTSVGTVQGFVEYLRWSGTDASPSPVGPTWFFADESGRDLLSRRTGGTSWEHNESGWVMQVRFAQATRLQTYQGQR